MARNMSLFKRLKAENRKNGRDTKVAVDASGSISLILIKNAILTINTAIISEVENPIPNGIV